MPAEHRYRTRVRWTGNLGRGTREYTGYSRDHTIEVDGKPEILASSGLSPRADPARHNPEELLVAALSSCHMLWYLHLCSRDGIVVVAYDDRAEGTLRTEPDGSGRLVDTLLRPHVTVQSGSLEGAVRLHDEAHRLCFIANSVNFPVRCEPTVVPEAGAAAEAARPSG